MHESRYDERESGLLFIFKIMWKRRWMIILGTGAATVLAVIIVLLLPKTYLSRAVVSMSTIWKADQEDLPKGMAIPVYKRFTNTVYSRELFRRFLKKEGLNGTWDPDEQFFDTHFRPVYAFDEGKPGVRTIKNSIIGVEIKGMARSAKKARDRAYLMGNYILTTILNTQIATTIDSMASKSQAAIVQLDKTIIQLEFETRYLKEKEALITNQLLKLPGIGDKTDRELVTANENTEKYLSPQQQLVAVKVSIKDNQIQMHRHRRNIKINRILLNFIERTERLFPENGDYIIDEGLLESLLKEKERLLPEKKDEEHKIASYILSEQFFHFQKRRNIVYKFISGPTLPGKHYTPKRRRIVVASCFLAFFIMAFAAFLVESGEQNRKYLISSPPETH